MTLRVTVVGDDLTGTVESSAVFHRYGFAGAVGIGLQPDARPVAGTAVWTVDTDTRQRPAGEAAERVRAALRAAPAPVLVAKLDSLLRGRLVAHLAALEPDRYPVVFAPALPVQGRVVVGGETRRADDGRLIGTAPLAELLAPLPTAVLPELAVPDLADRLAQTAQAGRIAICDAGDDAALDRIVAASLAVPGVRYAGSAGLIAALARLLAGTVAEPVEGHGPVRLGTSTGSAPVRPPVLFVIGTAAPQVTGQLEALGAAVPGTRCWTRPAGSTGWPDRTASQVRAHLAGGGSAVLRLPEPPPGHDAAEPDDAGLVAELADLTERAIAGTEASLVLTGGHTARAVLDRLGIVALDLRGEIHHGAVELGTASRSSGGGRTVVTRPGSFGGPDSLVRILDRLTAPTRQDRP